MWSSGCGSVLVDESVAGGVTSDRVASFDIDDIAVVVGCSLVESAVGSVGVVVLDVVVEKPFELVFVPDDGAVEEFVAEGPDPLLGVRVGPW